MIRGTLTDSNLTLFNLITMPIMNVTGMEMLKSFLKRYCVKICTSIEAELRVIFTIKYLTKGNNNYITK